MKSFPPLLPSQETILPEESSLLTPAEAKGLESIFKVLSSRTRLRLLHALIRQPDLSVGEISLTIGMKPQAVSNQLQYLQNIGILDSTRKGLKVHYRILDPCIPDLMEKGLCLLKDLPWKKQKVSD